MNAEESVAAAIAEWQHKYHIANDDPMIAVLELVQVYLQHAREIDDNPASPPPAFEDFRSTIELLDRRSKSFASEASDLRVKLSQFAQAVERINQQRFLTLLVFTVLGLVAGFFIGRLV